VKATRAKNVVTVTMVCLVKTGAEADSEIAGGEDVDDESCVVLEEDLGKRVRDGAVVVGPGQRAKPDGVVVDTRRDCADDSSPMVWTVYKFG
jgi:hypothetical protein